MKVAVSQHVWWTAAMPHLSEAAMLQPKALAFDVFGTVVDWRGGVAREAAPWLASIGRSDVDSHAFADAWRRRYPLGRPALSRDAPGADSSVGPETRP